LVLENTSQQLNDTVVNNNINSVILLVVFRQGGPGSSVGIATGYVLEGLGIESRWEARFSAPVQKGPGAHPASCAMVTGFSGGKERPGRDADPSPVLVPWS